MSRGLVKAKSCKQVKVIASVSEIIASYMKLIGQHKLLRSRPFAIVVKPTGKISHTPFINPPVLHLKLRFIVPSILPNGSSVGTKISLRFSMPKRSRSKGM